MSRRQKLIEQIKSGKTIDFDDVHQLLIYLEFTYRVAGSHYTYVKAPYVIGIAKHGKQLKRAYLEDVKDLLERMGL